MPDKKLTDNEIVKALECCVSSNHICSHTCPMLKNKECLASLRKYALTLINRLQEENERLLSTVQSCLNTACKQEDLMQMIAKEKQQYFDDLQTAKAENERLKHFEDKIAEFNSHIRVENMLVFASSLEEWLEFCDNLKAEAYKECIEKVKEKEELIELVEHLNKYEHCKKCIHLASCDAWVRHSATLYDDFDYSVEACPYFKELVGEDK